MNPTITFRGRSLLIAIGLAVLAACQDNLASPTGPGAPDAPAVGDVALGAGGKTKTDVCHRTENLGVFNLISIADPAVPAHLEHGDGRVGDTVPGQPGYVFDSTCAAIAAGPVLYLVGAQLYQATSTGAAQTLAYQYSTNSSAGGGHALFPIDHQSDGASVDDRGISIGLSLGDNVIDFRPATDGWGNFPVGYYGLNLFFDAAGTSFNPARCGAGIAGDLTVTVADGASAFSTVPSGSSVQSYTTSNLPGGACLVPASANGATSVTAGGYSVEVVAFSESGVGTCGFGCVGGAPDPSGSFTLRVAPAP